MRAPSSSPSGTSRAAPASTIASAFRGLTTTSEFALERIEVEGATLASTDAIETRLAGYLGRNLLELNLRELDAIAAGDPWVERATSKRLLPDTVRIELQEKRPVAQALVNGRGYLIDDAGGMICVAGPHGRVVEQGS